MFTLKWVKPAAIKESFRWLWLFAENESRKLEFLSNVQLHSFHQMPPCIPKRRNVGVDEDGTIEILNDRYWKSIEFSLVDY